MGNRGQKRAETIEALPADKRPCASRECIASSSGTSAQTPINSIKLPPDTNNEGDMETSSSNSESSQSDVEKDSAYGSCDSDDMTHADRRKDLYREYQQQRSSNDYVRLKGVLSNLSEGVDQSALLAALTELCELLSFCTEDSLSTSTIQSLSPIVVKLSKHDSNPDIMLLSIRAITYLCDAHSRSSSYLVKHNAVPELCQKLQNIEYLDVAEQCLEALEKISREQPLPCLQSGVIMAVLKYVDFFSTSVQRVALSTAVNICKKLPSEYPPSLMEAVPLLCNLLQYEDVQLVENVATCLIYMVKQVCHSSEKLDELCKYGLIHQATHLINLSNRSTLSPDVQSGLIGILVKLGSGSIVAFRTLFELNIGNIIKDILSTYDRSHGTHSYILVDGTCQVHEVLKLLNELLPATSPGQDSNIDRDKKIILLNQPDLLQRFAMDLLPVLIQVVNSGGSLYVCYCCLSVVNKLVYLSNSDMLLEFFNSTNISSFLAGVFTRKDHHVLILALQIVDNILQKHADVLLCSFVKEGILFAVDTLVTPKRCSQYMFQMFNGIQLVSDQIQRSAAKDVPKCLCYAFETTTSPSTSTPQTCKLETNLVYNLAEHIRSKYFATELSNSKEGTSDIFQKLKAISASLTDMVNLSMNSGASTPNETAFDCILHEIMLQLNARDPISTFEFLESGIVKSLVGYLSVGHCICGKADTNGTSSHVYTVEKRFQVLGRLLLSSPDRFGDTFLTELVHKLQIALSSVENFPVILNNASKQRNYYATVPYGCSISHPCMKVQFVRGEGELHLNEYSGHALSVDPFSSLDAIEKYLWPKVTGNRTKSTSFAASQMLNHSPSEPSSPQCECPVFIDSESMSRDLHNMQDEKPSSIETESGKHATLGQTTFEVHHDSGEQKQHLSSPQENSNLISTCSQSCNCGDGSSNLSFYLDEKHLDHKLTLYQAIVQHHTKAEGNISSVSLWSQAYTLTFKRADKCKHLCSQLQHQQASCSYALEKNSTYPHYTPFFSDMFASDLGSDIEKSTPACDILLLLKVLESMNRFRYHLISREKACAFAEGRINNLDDLNVSVAYAPQNEFVNCRLTEKLEQQIRDPLSVSIGGMPAWCSQLMSSCPFLFSFEVRCRYFQLAALGQRQHQPHPSTDSNAGGSNSRQHNSSSLPRKKFIVHRDQILESATQMMNLHSNQKVVLEAEFKDEVGTGLGPTLEFYTLVSYEFQKFGLGMWREDHLQYTASKSFQEDDSLGIVTACGLFPRPWSSELSFSDGVDFTVVIKMYTLLGQVVAKALQDRRILDLPFSKAFYKLILGQDLTIYDIPSFDPELGTTLLEFQAIVERNKYLKFVRGTKSSGETESCFRDTRIEDLCLDFSVPGYPDYVTSGCNSKMVDMNNLEEYVSVIVDATVHSGISRQVEAFKLGFDQVFPIKHLQILTEEEVERLLCGEREVWNIHELLDHIKFDHGYTASSPPVVDLLDIIREFDHEQQKAFLRFVTGAPRLPHGGLASLNPKLTIVRKHCSGIEDNDLPSAMTCANFLKLPPYSSKEKMREKLLYAITEGQGSFDLS